LCPGCARPLATCLCDLATPVANRVDTLVLQHPQEQRQAKNSVTLLRLSLARCTVRVGDVFAADTLAALLHPPGRLSLLLYPDTPGATAAPAAPGPLPPHDQLQLVVLDGTWRKSLKMLLAHPALQALPRLALAAPPPTHYRVIRKARRSDQVSTLEATCHALAQLEGDATRYAPLLAAFEGFVQREQALHHPPPPSL